MRFVCPLMCLAAAMFGVAMGGEDAEKTAPPKPAALPAGVEAYVNKMLAFDKNKDGSLTREEITDERLVRVFDRADADKNGIVTRDELIALATKEVAAVAEGGDRGRGPGGPGGDGGGGFGGPGGGGPGGPGGPGGQQGQIIPSFMQDALKLSDDQKKQLADLQKEVDAKVEKLLTDEQKAQLKTLRERPGRRPGGPGGPGRQ